RDGDNGFQIRIEGEPESYEPGREYWPCKARDQHLVRGFSIHAQHVDTEEAAGSFMPVNAYTSRVSSSCPSYIHHVISGKRNRVMVRWTAPVSGFGCVKISATVVQKGRIWFKQQGRLSLNICERVEVVQPNRTQECCACGNSTYRMTFYGLWSPSTHPKDYPTYSTHWSNVIGASHSSEYSIWDYGKFSSPAVQKVAEWGWPNDVETEVTSQGDHVMSVIKTPAQWPAYQPRNLRNPPSDTFQVDRSRHLVSLLSMLGPSPDWNVGITKESMCTADCGWVGTRVYNLTPWDAGTDSGVSYLSPNSPTNPRQRIRALTTLDDPESPFYKQGGGAIEPVAKIVVTRTGLSDGQCGESEAVLEQYDAAETSQSTSNKVALCLYSEWGGWSHCGVTCGWGIKTRNREMTMQKSSVACTATMQKEICKGMGDWEIPGCNYGEWSDWSVCPVTCGEGQTFRKRMLRSGSHSCDGFQMENSKCMTSMSCTDDDQSECRYSNWSEWMPCSESCGTGATLRKKFLLATHPINVGLHTGDARSNCEGLVMENGPCHNTPCQQCAYLPWTPWMPCSVTCGKGETLRKRFLNQSASGSGCEGFQMEQNRCMVPSPQNCVVKSWGQWSRCNSPGRSSRQLRVRKIKTRAKFGGAKCPRTFERRRC
uniref:Spondin-1 n=1 Tax=Ciona savignyi TaxID=51511 RepID=H2Z0J4_CIOSA